MAYVAYRSYAKINLTLEVVRRREDGYHDLASLVHTISLADELHLHTADELSCRVDGLDIDPAINLVTRSARLLAAMAGVPPGAEVLLVKHIPVAAGLGGGSSDAATTLVGLNRLWLTDVQPAALVRVAASLGSDIPFFLRGGAAVIRGRGEELDVVPPVAQQWLVLVAPQHELIDKTARLYASLDQRDFSSGDLTERAAGRLKQRLPLRPDDLVNAFARAARTLFPGLSTTWRAVERMCDRPFFLSGAGPAIFALAVDRADAQRQQTRLAAAGLTASAACTLPRARTLTSYG